MHFANCATLAAALFTTLIENLRFCSSAEAEIILNFFLNFEEKWASCSYKIVFIKQCKSVDRDLEIYTLENWAEIACKILDPNIFFSTCSEWELDCRPNHQLRKSKKLILRKSRKTISILDSYLNWNKLTNSSEIFWPRLR